MTTRGTEYEDGVIYRIGDLNEDGSGYYARTEEGELTQPLLLLPSDWVDAVFMLDDDPLYIEIPPQREDYDFGDDGGYSKRWVRIELGKIALSFPNLPSRVRAVRFHDLHHVLTGYVPALIA